jgi:peptidoglycan-associated lipoprotein
MNLTSQKPIRCLAILVAMISIRLASPAQAQFKDYGTPGLGAGLHVGGLLGKTDLSDKPDVQVRGYLSHGLTTALSAEMGAGYASLKGREYRTDVGLVDLRLVAAPFQFKRVSPFLFAGVSALRYDWDQIPRTRTAGAKTTDWTGAIPVGAGMKFKLTERISMDLSGGYTHTFSDVLDASALKAGKDVYWGAKLGFDLGRHPDPDRDGLYAKAEKRLGTDPKRSDTDGDGLSDGEETKKHRTNPLARDTDGDELSDGDEVNRYRTNPLRADTDGDGVADGTEVALGRDPLAASAQVAKAEAPKVAVAPPASAPAPQDRSAAPSFQAVYFDFDRYTLREDQKVVLVGQAERIKASPKSKLILEGHCDERGTIEYNLALGQKRADSVKSFLVKSGVAAGQLTTVSYGKERPADPGHHEAAWAKNRRVELVPAEGNLQALQE